MTKDLLPIVTAEGAAMAAPSAVAAAPPSLLDYTPEQLAEILKGLGYPAYRARQLLQWAYRGVVGYDGMSDLPKELRQRLSKELPVRTLTPVESHTSADKLTHKTLFRLPDGPFIETVLMAHPGAKGRWRSTICVSSQAGCAYGCRFCATGQQGYGRNLSPGEILQQVLFFLLGEQQPPGARRGHGDVRGVTNVVFMGMGEPFANYGPVMDAVRAMNAPWGLGLGSRRITVSTVGLVPEIERFAREPYQAGLAISLHAPDDVLRSSLMPVNRKYALPQLMAACRDYVAKTNRRVTFEYILIDYVNDGIEHARQLVALLQGLLCHVNLIPMNPTAADELRRPSPARMQAFVAALEQAHVPVTLRDTQGVDIQAGCGQLSARNRELAATPGR